MKNQLSCAIRKQVIPRFSHSQATLLRSMFHSGRAEHHTPDYSNLLQHSPINKFRNNLKVTELNHCKPTELRHSQKYAPHTCLRRTSRKIAPIASSTANLDAPQSRTPPDSQHL
ncbi:hypothetical protein M758_10G007400 [Ceratodon purpureus]|uniref:Uncharacterized protein n=1 Tax=Ceratodon purpureus TaxID=3225 RepID=A0A8T0GM89_CERPU|nr:hypothetical protein KC19_10G008400 [Ceratodon purpureus]KAG0602330.1 hypothetical protein M758_10G007400 [Ceratodon purpureus]